MIKGKAFHLGIAIALVFLVTFCMVGSPSVRASELTGDTLPPIVDEYVPQILTKSPMIRSFGSTQPGVDVNVSNLGGNESEVSIDVNPINPDNQVIVGHSGQTTPPDNFRDMNTFFTFDGGQTWALVPLDSAQDGLASVFRFDPTVAFDDNGTLYVAYGAETQDASGNDQVTVVVARSTDGGVTYTQFTQLDTNLNIGNLPGNDKWHLATGPDPTTPSQQNVYIAWTHNVREPGTDQQIVVSVSTDGGATFSAPLVINDASISGTSGGNLFADPAVGPNGELYVSWYNINTGDVFLDVSTDAGTTFGTDSTVATPQALFKTGIPAQPDRGIFVGPTIDTDRSGGSFDGRLYMTYVDVASGGVLPDTDIFVRFSSDQGSTWSAPVLVNDDGGSNSQFLPWLDVDQQTGVVSVVWYDARNDTNNNGTNNQLVEVFMAISDDGGATFGTNILVSDGQSDQSTNNPNRWGANYLEYIGIAMFGCRAYPVWADNSTNLADLDFFTDQVLITGSDTSLCQAPVCDADGPYEQECQGTTTNIPLDGASSEDPKGGDLSFLWTTDCPGGSFDDFTSSTPQLTVNSSAGCTIDCNVTLTVTDEIGLSEECSSTVSIIDTTTPAITCPEDVIIECDQSTDPVNTGYAIATDICDPSPVIAYSDAITPGSCLEEYTISRTWTATDGCGNQSSCLQTITVVDTTPPVITCNAPATITPPDAPISFAATAIDNCDSAPVVESTLFDCFDFTNKGKRIDKTESCVVDVSGNTITILDSGGVGDNITWDVLATDSCGNQSEEMCEIEVVNPGRRP